MSSLPPTVASNLSSSLISTSNSTTSILIDPGSIYKSYTIASFLIGFLITMVSSILNAFGINLQKLDLNRTQKNHQSTSDCMRPVWLIGLALYVISQVLGSTLALQYMRSEYVAPLGSASLIFNFLFARWLLGTKITTLDLIGTLVIIVGVVGVIGFGNIRQAGIDQEANMSLSTLQALWARPAWISYLIGLEFITIFLIWLASITFGILQEKLEIGNRNSTEDDEDDDVELVLRRGGGRNHSSRSNSNSTFTKFLSRIIIHLNSLEGWLKRSIERWSVNKADQTLMKLDGLLWGCSAGLLAGQTLIFAKSFVKLVTNGFGHDGRGQPEDLGHPLSILILLFLASTGILQVWCLNKGLKVYDSTLIVPVLFATYTASGFVNSLIYLHELPTYRRWVLLMIWLCIVILIAGVYMLSSKRPESSSRPKAIGNYSSSSDPEGEVQETAIGSRHARINAITIQPNLIKRDRNGSVMSLGELKDHLKHSFKMIPKTSLAPDDDDDDDRDEDRNNSLVGSKPINRSSIIKNPFEEYEIEDGEHTDENDSDDDGQGISKNGNDSSHCFPNVSSSIH